jgi:GNAT superfamily N-acetyltransferase
MFYIELVDSGNIDRYRDIRPDIYTVLSGYIKKSLDYCATIAFFPGQAVGLAFARDVRYKERWELLWPYVLSKFRRLGIARALFAGLEEAVLRKQGRQLYFVLPPDIPLSKCICPLLESLGYRQANHTLYTYRSEALDLYENIGWIKACAIRELEKRDSVPLGEYELFKWHLLQESDIRYLESGKGTDYPAWAYPLDSEKFMRKDLSLGIRHGNRPIGWIHTSADVPGELFMMLSFLHEQYRNTPLFPTAYATILHLQVKAGIKYMASRILSTNKHMLSFMENAFENRIQSVVRAERMLKDLF